MPAIITVTFNPAVDKNIPVPALIAEKKLKCPAPVYEPGGGGINVARAIKKLGGDATAVYLAGGETGKKITALLTGEDIESVVIPIKGDTRENLVVSETESGRQYLFDMPGPTIREHEWRDCLNRVEHLPGVQYIVASGSLPPGVPTDIFARLALIARKKNARLIIDTSGEALKAAVNVGVYLVKPNLRELCSLAGREEPGDGMETALAREIIGKGGCEAVVVSLGSEGALLVTKDTSLQVRPPHEKINSTVGAGDSMVAGMVLSLAAGKSLPDAVRYGVACGTAATMNTGTELCRKEDVRHLYNIIQNEAVETLCQ